MEKTAAHVFLIICMLQIAFCIYCFRKYCKFADEAVQGKALLVSIALKNCKEQRGLVVQMNLPGEGKKTIHAGHQKPYLLKAYVGSMVNVVYTTQKVLGHTAVDAYVLEKTNGKPYEVYNKWAMILGTAAIPMLAISIILFAMR